MKKTLKLDAQNRRIVLPVLAAAILAVFGGTAAASVTNPVIGRLLWAEEFNDATLNTGHWKATEGNGYSNAELQYYSPNNVSLTSVPFEPGTRALAIKALRTNVGGYPFTSGKIDSAGKVRVQYGMVEIRVATPNIDTGLWPAAWMLGSSPQTWPRNGEIDIMEMGHKAAIRAQASPPPGPNLFTGANVITYHPDACVPGNESCVASTAWQTRNWYIPSVSLANRFVTYRFYWTESQMRFTVVDNGVEHNLYNNPLPVISPSLHAPFYLLLNLAVGGQFTDAASPGQVTAPTPATMYVDYVRVYELDGKGKVILGDPILPETGKFGTFTDLSEVTSKQVAGTSSDIYLWTGASISDGNTAPFEGANVIAWNYTSPGREFGGGIWSRRVHDMSNFRANGKVKFKIKIPANVGFKIGVGDDGVRNYVSFPPNTTAYGLVRNGQWGTATIPVSALAGNNIRLDAIRYQFQIVGDSAALPTAPFQFAIDDVIWDSEMTPPPPTVGTVTQASATTLNFSVATTSWADVHYSVNNGAQQNFRMRHEGNDNTFSAAGLKIGDVIRYTFTYWDTTKNITVDTAQQSYTMK